MASYLADDGALVLVKDLRLAIIRFDFTSLEMRVIGAVEWLTYGAGKTKAVMSTEDIRYILGAEKKLKTSRIEEAIKNLLNMNVLFRQELVNGSQILGLQKDYDQWRDKMSPTLQEEYINNTLTTTGTVGDKMSPPERLLDYAQRKGNFKYGVTSWRVERKYAKRLYVEAIRLTGSPIEALFAIKDYIDENEWMRLNVKHQFTYMDSRFEAWFRQIPKKPREIREDEEALGRRYRYNVKAKTWEAT